MLTVIEDFRVCHLPANCDCPKTAGTNTSATKRLRRSILIKIRHRDPEDCLPRIPAPTRRPRPQYSPDHRNLPHVIARMRHHLPEHGLERPGNILISLMRGLDVELSVLRRRLDKRH